MRAKTTLVALAAAMMIVACGGVARADIVWAGDNLVDLDATGLATGAVGVWSNAGTLGDFVGTDGWVGEVGGVNSMLFAGTGLFTGPAAPASITGANPVSIEVWVMNPGIDGEETLVAWGKRGGPDGSNMSFNYGNHDAYGAVGHWGWPDLGWGTIPEAGQWHHLTYTFDGTMQRVYADGVETASEDVAAILDVFGDPAGILGPIRVASQTESDGTTATGGLRGSLSIAKVRIHDGALAAADVAANYAAEQADFPFIEPPEPPEPEQIPSGPVHRWSFSEEGGAGTTLVDSVGGADGTIVDLGANDGTVGGGQVTLAGGAKDASDYVDLSAGILAGLTDATIETWATQHTVQNWSRIFDIGENNENYVFMSWTIGTDLNADRAGINVAGETSIDGAMAPYDLDTEFHIALTIEEGVGAFGSNLLSLYKDGVLQGSRTTSHSFGDLNDVSNFLGRSQWGDNTANASWNEFRIYDYALTEAQLLGNAGAGPDAVNLVPEPGSVALLLLGLIGLAAFAVRRKK